MSDPTGQDDTRPLPLPLARRVDEVCCRFEAAWKAVAAGGEPPRLEAYLVEVAEPGRSVLRHELLQVEAHHRRRAGLDTDSSERDPASRTPAGIESQTAPMPLFLDALGRSELLDPQQTQALLGQAGGAGRPGDLAAWLVSRGWLTDYQARRLLAGQPDELVLGSYRLLEPLGEGGMGQVFRARHALMNRVVAVKLIHPDVVHDPLAVRRFRREIQAAAQLSHPNVVVAHDAEEAGGRHFLVMEFCEGRTLRELVEQAGPLPVPAACEYARQAALGLQHAFERGLIHRDIKPANLMLAGATVKVLDFGLARLRPAGDAPPTTATKEGAIVGTPDFMAPEQAEGRPDVRSDLYSLGCTLYFLLSGRVPFPGGGLIDKCLRHRIEEPQPLGPGVPAPVQEVVRRLMAKRPGDRFQTPAEVAAALAPFTSAGPATVSSAEPAPRPRRVASRSRRVAIGVGAALAVGIVCVVAFVVLRKESDPVSPRSRGKPPPPPRLRTWRKSKELPIPPKQASTYALAFSPDSRWLAAAFGNNEDSGPVRPGRLHVWEVAGWRVALDREVKSGPGACVAFSPDGKTLACGAACWEHDVPGHVTLWNVADWAEKADFEAHRKGVLGLAFHPRDNLLVTSGREGKVLLWDGERGTPRRELTDRKAPVVALAFSPDGGRLAIGCDDGSVDLWEVGTPRQLGPLPGTPGKPVRGLAFSADGQTLLAVTKRGQWKTADLLSWDLRDRRVAPAIPVGETEAYCLAVSPDRASVLAGCQNMTAKLYETATRREVQSLKHEKAPGGYDRPFLCLAFSADGRYLATSGGWFGPVQLWEEVE